MKTVSERALEARIREAIEAAGNRLVKTTPGTQEHEEDGPYYITSNRLLDCACDLPYLAKKFDVLKPDEVITQTRRARHMLAGKVIAEQYGRTGTLPSSRSIAAAASVHPATARRWLADMRAVMPLKASALTVRSQP
jgi:hypothetical protein